MKGINEFIFAIARGRKRYLSNFLVYVAKKYGGFTLLEGLGGWYSKKKLFLEKSYLLQIDGMMKLSDVYNIVTMIKTLFNQSAVLYRSFKTGKNIKSKII